MRIVKDGYGLIGGSLIGPGVLAALFCWAGWMGAAYTAAAVGVVGIAFFVYFFRDPERVPPPEPDAIVSGADGVVRAVERIQESKYLHTETLRISVFLNPFDVHVNRAPLGGVVKGLAYTPGKHLLTMNNASSEYNEHSSILIEGEQTRCLVRQIVGPVVRRVVYWLELEQVLAKGDRIGMMKFGSRMDIYLPADDVEVVIKKGQRVRAGETVVARIRKKNK
jgi:phosphatidylserine decarboxylase